jgi:hypothetical protein
MSKGEERVRVLFNPANNDAVNELKQLSARFIDLCQKIGTQEAMINPGTNVDPEQLRLIALAQTAAEEAAMWAVKAVTFKKEN